MTERITAAQFNSQRAKPRDIEGPIQIEIVEHLRRVLPDGCLVHHVKNEIKRGGYSFAKEQDKARRMGSISGWPDLLVVTYMGVFFFEVKAPKGYPTKRQKQVHDELRHMGYGVAVVRSVADVEAFLSKWNVCTQTLV